MKFDKKIFGFTLAEVLITLGIIGIVAEVTIPTLYNGFAKQTTVTKLQNFYSNMSQAIKLSEIDNGPSSTWNYGNMSSGSDTLIWFNTYLAPYIKYTKITNDTYWTYVYFVDGSVVAFYCGGYMDTWYYANGLTKTVNGKDVFVFEIVKTTNQMAFRPYDSGTPSTTGRDKWKTGGLTNYECVPSALEKRYCAGLILEDSWQIKSDYPYFN